jgi:hypothetical protein
LQKAAAAGNLDAQYLLDVVDRRAADRNVAPVQPAASIR